MPEWVLRAFEPGHEQKINQAFNRVFGQSRSLEEWQWKFLQCPWGHAILAAETRSGELLAHFAAIPTPFQLGQGRVLIGQGVDAFRTDLGPANPGPENVYRATARAFFERYCLEGPLALLYGLAGRRHAQVLTSHLGWRAVGTLPTLEASLAGFRRRNRPRRLFLGFSMDLWSSVWSRAQERFPVVAWRDEAFVRWRFLLHPRRPYRFLFCSDGEEACAAAVLRVRGDTCYVVDVLWDGEDALGFGDLLFGVAILAQDWGCRRALTWIHGDPGAREMFTAQGWMPSPEFSDIAVTAISARGDLDPRSFWENAFITMADGDLV